MARLKALPELEIIKGFRGILDFALWKGLPYARRWPRSSKASQTPATRAAALIFGQVLRLYSLLAAAVLTFYIEDAKTQPRTPRDIMVSGVYGHLHEASMSDFLTLLQESRDFLSQLTALLNALDSVGTDEIDVNVEESVLPTGAATSANQTTAITSLQTIDNLANALDSVGTDELDVNVEESVLPTGAATSANQATALTSLQLIDDLSDALESTDTDALQVRGRDQLWSVLDTLVSRNQDTISGAGGNLDSNEVPAGHYWHITYITAFDVDNPTTALRFTAWVTGSVMAFHQVTQAFASGEPYGFPCELWIKNPDNIRVRFTGALDGDTCVVGLFGHDMTIET